MIFANQNVCSLEYGDDVSNSSLTNQNVCSLEYGDDVSNSSLTNHDEFSNLLGLANDDDDVLGATLSFNDLHALVQGGGEIVLMNDYTYNPETDNLIHNGLGIALATNTVIEGNGHIINANFQTMIFRANAAEYTFNNVVFMNAITQPNDCPDNVVNGGAIRLMNGRLTLYNCTFIANTATSHGGAVYVGPNSHLETSLCTFKSNKALSGGAVYAEDKTQIVLTSSTFNQNIGDETGWGGAVRADEVLCQRSSFTANIGGRGGAVNAKYGTFNYVNFYDNSASARGGAFVSDDGTKMSVFRNIICNGNTAKNGGAIGVQNGTISDSSFDRNEAKDYGGAIEAGILGMSGCSFKNNKAGKDGGAVTVNTISDYTVDRYNFRYCKFISNSARNGGAVYMTSKFED